MKVAILTQPLTNNYGGILQNYSLQVILRRKGHDVVTLNIQRPFLKQNISLHWVLSISKRFIQKYLLHNPHILFVNSYKQVNFSNKPQKFQQRFIDEYIKILNIGPEPLTEVHDIYDAYIVGSDQVWRPCFSPCLSNFYLDFVKNPKAIRVAYAASFGVEHWEADKVITEKIGSLAQKFNGLSVREQSAIRLCKEHLYVDVTHVLDPTMLLSSEDYRKLYRKHITQVKKEKYIAVYILDRNPEIKKLIHCVSKHLSIPIIQIGTFSKNGYESVESWLESIDNASYVITDSYHGSIFSIIFGKNFVTVGNISRGMTRFDGLFSLLNLNDRLVSTSQKAIKALQNTINYDKVFKIIIEKQDSAHKFFYDNSI